MITVTHDDVRKPEGADRELVMQHVFAVTPTGRLLDARRPDSLASMVRMFTDPVMSAPGSTSGRDGPRRRHHDVRTVRHFPA
ncbi:hypothetical protein [Streptomyces sp. LHD-70]|uniref:hypothetical protein n=1 Tax=Streptomyces sp. LHD-70 TaxID=3072140 RepID=UPI0035BE8420